jgi:ribonuclease P protein component
MAGPFAVWPGACRPGPTPPRRPTQTDTSAATLRQRARHGHEAHLPTVEDPPGPYPRFSRTHEVTRWPRGHQRSPRQGAQAPGGLSARAGNCWAPAMIGRLRQGADFQRLLAAPMQRRTAHFCLQFVHGTPTVPRPAVKGAGPEEFSTGSSGILTKSVDNSVGSSPSACPAPVEGRWLGCVVPKRHARRSVTRSMLKRQMRAAAERHVQALAPGLWLLRLRSGFPIKEFPSADSAALRAAARVELDTLLQRPLPAGGLR